MLLCSTLAGLQRLGCFALGILMATKCKWSGYSGLCCGALIGLAEALCNCHVDNQFILCQNTFDYNVWIAEINYGSCKYQCCRDLQACLKRCGSDIPPCPLFVPPPKPTPTPGENCLLNEGVKSAAAAVFLFCGCAIMKKYFPKHQCPPFNH
jgi:hypothetical protein